VPVLHLLAERGAARFIELQRKLGVGSDSLRRALDALVKLGYVRRNPGYGHPLRPEYLVTDAGREVGDACSRMLRIGNADLLLRKWSVPTLAQLGEPLRFSELRAALPGVTPRSLALALKELETAGLVRREVVDSRPPSTLYRATARGAPILRVL
jgi:DNA-binding HxlR family transcriptional regulator